MATPFRLIHRTRFLKELSLYCTTIFFRISRPPKDICRWYDRPSLVVTLTALQVSDLLSATLLASSGPHSAGTSPAGTFVSCIQILGLFHFFAVLRLIFSTVLSAAFTAVGIPKVATMKFAPVLATVLNPAFVSLAATRFV